MQQEDREKKYKKYVNIPVSSQITARVNKELLPLVAKAERLAKYSRMAKRRRAYAADVLDLVSSACTCAYDFAQSASLLEQANAMSA